MFWNRLLHRASPAENLRDFKDKLWYCLNNQPCSKEVPLGTVRPHSTIATFSTRW
jgi:hypothetical protein